MTDYNAHLLGEGKSPRRDSREFFGRLELPQDGPSDESTSAAPTANDDFKSETESTSIWEKLNSGGNRQVRKLSSVPPFNGNCDARKRRRHPLYPSDTWPRFA